VGTSIPGIVKNHYRGVSWVSSIKTELRSVLGNRFAALMVAVSLSQQLYSKVWIGLSVRIPGYVDVVAVVWK